ncbi:hypothetical protein ACX80L_11595 [Arthrobacter sp. MDT1-48-3]
MIPSPADPVGSWRTFDDAVALTFDATGGESRPSCLHWRGSAWHVVDGCMHWSTWRALPVAPSPSQGTAPTRGLRADFWRFRAQTSGFSPVLHFEVRRAEREWRLVRLRATFELPEKGTEG